MSTLAPEHLAKYAQRRIKELHVEWIAPHIKARIRSLTERERYELERQVIDNGGNVRTLLIAASLVDDDGYLLFSDTSFLETLDSDLIEALYIEIDKHVSEIQRAANVARLAKNLETIHDDALPSD